MSTGMTWRERILLTLLLLGLGCGLSFLYWPREAPAQCATAYSAEMAYDDMACVVFNRPGVRNLRVPRRYRVKALVACLGDKQRSGKFGSLLVFGLGKRGQVKCSGYGPTGGGQFEACGLLW